MIRLSKIYKNAIKKYGTKKVLEMYRDNKIKLTDDEWNNLHKKIEKENKGYLGLDNSIIIAFILCVFVVLIASLFLDNSNHEKIKKCNEIKGHTCSRYEIESMGD